MAYVYFLIDPRDRAIRYVGQTSKTGPARLKEHVDASRRFIGYRVNRWIRELLKLELIPDVVVMNVEDPNHAEALWIEILTLAGSRLTNMTKGGESFRRGIPHRPETIAKMKRAHVGRTWTSEQVEKRAAKRRRPFRCIETGEVFASIEDFIRTGRGSSKIKVTLNGHRPDFKGLHYERLA